MKQTHTLNLQTSKTVFNIVESSQSSYLDNRFYDRIQNWSETVFKNINGSANQPVILKGMDVQWLLNNIEGLKFLLKLSNHKVISFYETEAVKIIVQFLWSHYKNKIIFFTLIPYIIYHVLFLILIFYNENYFQGDDVIVFSSG